MYIFRKHCIIIILKCISYIFYKNNSEPEAYETEVAL